MSVGTAYTIVRNVVLQMATKSDFKSACELVLTVKEELDSLLKEPLEQTLSLVSEFQLPDHKVVAENIVQGPPSRESVVRAVLDLLVEITKIKECGFTGVKVNPTTAKVYEPLYQAVLCLLKEPIYQISLLAAAKLLVGVQSEMPAVGGWRDSLKILLLELVEEGEDPTLEVFDKKNTLCPHRLKQSGLAKKLLIYTVT